MVAVWGIKICALKAPVQWRWSYTILYFAPKDNSPFFIVLPFFTYFHTAPPNLGVFDRFFAIRNEYHIIGDECGSSMVCMQPWFTCSFGLHALCSLLYWVQFVKTQGKVQNFIKTACRAADCMGIYSPIPALYGSVGKEQKVDSVLEEEMQVGECPASANAPKGSWLWNVGSQQCSSY